MKKIDVFLLAAGESSRMFPLSQIMEKSLLPVNGKPVIRHIIENLTQPEVARHIRRIIICCLTKFKKQFEHEFRDMPSIEFKDFDEPRGTFATFYEAVQKTSTDWVMVHYADCMTDINYTDFLNHPIEPYADGVIAVTNNIKHDYSEVRFKDGIVTRFWEKPPIPNYTWTGIALFNRENFINLPYKSRIPYDGDIAGDVFPVLVRRTTLLAFSFDGYWYDVGNLNSYRKVCALYDGSNGNVKL